MARLVVSQHVKTGTQASINELAVQPDMIKITMQDEDRARG